MAPKLKGLKQKAAAPAATPRKRPATQMSGSPELQAPATPTPSGGASATSQARTVRPYRSPEVEVEDEAEEPDIPESEAPKDECTVLGWKVAARCVIPESTGRLRAGSRLCCVECAHTYYNFPGQMCWVPSGMAKCADCLRSNHACIPAAAQFGVELEALQLAADDLLNCWADDEDANLAADSDATVQAIGTLLAVQRIYSNATKAKETTTPKKKGSLVELGKAKTEGLKAATQVFHASVNKVLDAYQSGLEEYVNTMKFLVGGAPHPVMPASLVMPSPIDLEHALLERLFMKPSKWKFNTPPPAPQLSTSVSIDYST
ncbi:hypothetical protein GMDG_04888 [Pseudogymnoascus destructans 20631-21]|uniref:Uncharacterized protein n=1 Tax=Pseudogymnoascus destructans (strain ATCC MYA-4855 / 20631-21) TaxID=658429 RepID=L8GCT1_PSED2|nr:hypothetical protein GMDG_04888 [Pseudogymnoascus destructans 20631-21]